MRYTVHSAKKTPEMKGLWNGPAWKTAGTLEISHFRPESSSHRPETQAKLLYDSGGIYGIFSVKDKYVRCVHRGFQSPVYIDSCVEFFFMPDEKGYFNFEFSCGGALLCTYIKDPQRTKDGFKDFVRVAGEDARLIRIHHSLPETVEPEISEETAWTLEFHIPFSLISRYAGEGLVFPGRECRANFYKCGDGTSHPHWAAWAPVDEKNFHLPRCFGLLSFKEQN